jgi:GTP cyclohydrolase I
MAKKSIVHVEKPNIEEGSKIVRSFMDWLKIPINNSTKGTPDRVAKMYVNELFNGLYTEPPVITTFDDGADGYVCVKDIFFHSLCEHHLLPFFGKCAVVYYSKKEVIGLSKIPRIVKYWSSRPQLQERLTRQIAEDIMKRLKPNGVYVVMSAQHLCMEFRGIQAIGSKTNTALLLGDIDKDEAIRLLEINKFFDK